MKKTTDVKTTKLMVDDHIKLGGTLYRITSLNLNYGRGVDRVRIMLRSTDSKKPPSYIQLTNVSTKARFTIFNQ